MDIGVSSFTFILDCCFGASCLADRQFDRSPLEFASGAQNNLTYAVEKNDWKTNWPGRQDIKQPYRITFSLNSLQGVYVLKISTLCSSTM
jgi:hypothetical protein